MAYTGNIGYLFQHLYYRDINFLAEKDNLDNDKEFKDHNRELFTAKFADTCLLEANSAQLLKNSSFRLVTNYPGLVAGKGNIHETGLQGELKLGFSFDFTFGLPIIPGSSVKGIIRAVIENDVLFSILIESIEDRQLREKIKNSFDRVDFANHVFGNESKSSYRCDIFFDAVPYRVVNNNYGIVGKEYSEKRLLGEDTICPHRNPLKNPVPISFLKVMPEVEFEFRFRLTDSGGLTIAEKEKLFNTALQVNGAGAKTNVGYGQLLPPSPMLIEYELPDSIKYDNKIERGNVLPAKVNKINDEKMCKVDVSLDGKLTGTYDVKTEGYEFTVGQKIAVEIRGVTKGAIQSVKLFIPNQHK